MFNIFKLEKNKTNHKTELIGGVTAALSMLYIFFLAPNILSLAGMDINDVFVATILTAIIGTSIIGLKANLPVIVAPGVGMLGFFTFGTVLNLGLTWETSLFAIFCSGIIFLIISISGARQQIINSIPKQLQKSIIAGIGLFIAFVGLKTSGLVVQDPAVFVKIGDLTNQNVQVAIFGLIITIILIVKKTKFAIFFGIIAAVIFGLIIGAIKPPSEIMKIPELRINSFGKIFTNGASAVNNNNILSLLFVIFTFVLVDLFDTSATIMAVFSRMNKLPDEKQTRAAFIADSTAVISGAVLGTTSSTTYIESLTGIEAGSRTGLSSMYAVLVFIVILFLSPLAVVISGSVTGPALIIIGMLMFSEIADIDLTKNEILIPAFLTIIGMAFSGTIAKGIAFGFIFHALIQIVLKKKISPIFLVITLLLLLFLIVETFLKTHI
jgi:AGZA family xanthine/uracil permease-like MFS transporter